jgi:hypothetical protein
LRDFDEITPPEGVTAENLADFCREIDRYAG